MPRQSTLLLWIALLVLPCQVNAYQRIASINLCTDQLLFQLEEPQHIASLSYLAAEPAYSAIHDRISGIPLNHAFVEEIIPLKPDLILAGSYTNIHTIFFLKNLGLNVQQLDIPFDLQGIEKSIMATGQLLGREQRADSIIQNMRERQQQVQQKVHGKRRPLAITIAPLGFTHGKHSMKGDLLEMAGFENLAAKIGITGSGFIDLETLIRYQPEYIIIEDEDPNKNSLAQRFLQHPALQRGLLNSQQIHIPSNLWACASYFVIDALEILANAHPET